METAQSLNARDGEQLSFNYAAWLLLNSCVVTQICIGHAPRKANSLNQPLLHDSCSDQSPRRATDVHLKRFTCTPFQLYSIAVYEMRRGLTTSRNNTAFGKHSLATPVTSVISGPKQGPKPMELFAQERELIPPSHLSPIYFLTCLLGNTSASRTAHLTSPSKERPAFSPASCLPLITLHPSATHPKTFA